MKYTILIYLFCWTSIAANAKLPVFSPDVITLDFSNGHSIDAFKKSGIKLNDISSSSRKSFSYQNQSLIIKLPGGRVFKQKVRLGIADGNDGELIKITTAGVVMPHDEAYQVAKKVHLNLGLPTDKLDQWYGSEKNQGRNANGYSISANKLMYPRVSLSIRSSMNKLYPWVLGLKISWYWKKHRDWDEKRANRENTRPLPQYATVSLEPPSGKNYDRSDAYNSFFYWIFIIGSVIVIGLVARSKRE
ncbi:MAG: hypothetical protein L3J39_10765 [Verrucomicrobiales bacterium]|nr:hypothetical protein [Verrucomicrobiales bacterium]